MAHLGCADMTDGELVLHPSNSGFWWHHKLEHNIPLTLPSLDTMHLIEVTVINQVLTSPC